MVVDGRAIAHEILGALRTKTKPQRFLAALLVGNNEAARSFLKQKERYAQELGIDFKVLEFPVFIETKALSEEMVKLGHDEKCGGIIVQLPLPPHINRQEVLDAIAVEKDPDMLSERAKRAFLTGVHPFVPPAVAVVQEILRRTGLGELQDAKAAVIGRGSLVGEPIATWLEGRVKELAVFDSRTENVREKLRDRDIVVSGAGSPKLFGANDLKDGALVIDFGYSHLSTTGKLVGDFDDSGISPDSRIVYTPTPGGTGPILVAKLFENFFQFCLRA